MCTYTHIYIYTYSFWMCNVRRIPELIGKLMGISRKKQLSYQHLLGPIYQTLAKTVSFCVMSQKKIPNCAFQLPTKRVSRVSKVGWFFFEAQHKGGFWNCCPGQMIREIHLSEATFRSLPKKQRRRWSLRLLNCLDLGNFIETSLIDFQGQGGC